MTARIFPVEPFDLVVLGDLALRKLLPGLYYRDQDRQLPAQSRVIAVARSPIDRNAYVREVEAPLRRNLPASATDDVCLKRLLGRLDYVALDAAGDHGWAELAANLVGADDRVRVFYLATAPDLFGPICRMRASARPVTTTAGRPCRSPLARICSTPRRSWW